MYESNVEGVQKNSPDYAKYWKMLQMGVPIGAVKQACVRNRMDPTILEFDPEKSLKSLREGIDKGDLEYAKYWKMLKVGVPMGAVKQACVHDRMDPAVMDLGFEKFSLEGSEGGVEPILHNDREYEKYWKMLNVGVPMGAVKQACVRDRMDPTAMDLDRKKSQKSYEDRNGVESMLHDEREHAKCSHNVRKKDLQIAAAYQAHVRDGMDPSISGSSKEKSLMPKARKGRLNSIGSTLRNDSQHAKYWKIFEVCLPIWTAKHVCVYDGKDRSIAKSDYSGVPLRDDPEYAVYWKMLKIGLPMEAAKHACVRDGKDPSTMDLDPDWIWV